MPKPTDELGQLGKALAAFQAKAASHDADTSARMVRAYGSVEGRLSALWDDLLSEVQAASDAGKPISRGQLVTLERYHALLTQATREAATWAQTAAPMVESLQVAQADTATEAARAMALASLLEQAPPAIVREVMDSWNTLDPGAILQITAVTSEGSPLHDLLQATGLDTVAQMKAVLLQGVATGQNTRSMGRRLSQVSGLGLTRSLTIARTEGHRAQREATRLTYQANKDVVTWWTWRSARSTRTCAMCWARDGSRSPVGDDASSRMATHVNCRCVMVPYTSSSALAKMGVATPPRNWSSGWEAFKALPEGTQRQILGPLKFKAFQAGAISPETLVGSRVSKIWGKSQYEKPLKEILQPHQLEALLRGEALPKRLIAEKPKAPPKPKAAPLPKAKPFQRDLTDPHEQAAEQAREAMLFGEVARKKAQDALIMRLREKERIASTLEMRGQAYDMAYAQAVEEIVGLREELLAVRQPGGTALRADPPGTARPLWGAGLDAHAQARIQGAVDTFNSLVDNPAVAGRAVQFTGADRDSALAGRSFYRSGRSSINADPADVASRCTMMVVHEMGHWLEDNDPTAHAMALEFLERRTRGEKAVTLESLRPGWGYTAWETTRPDQFRDPYIGRTSYSGSEVISMGVQYLQEDPVGFAVEDPDHFRLAWRVAHGRY